MARDLGPEMLAELDQQLADGLIDKYTWEVRRVQALEQIRKGETIETSPGERAVLVVGLICALLVGGVVALMLTGIGRLIAVVVTLVVVIKIAMGLRRPR